MAGYSHYRLFVPSKQETYTYQLDGVVTVSIIVVLEEQEINEEYSCQQKNLLVNRGIWGEGQAERVSLGELRETHSPLLRVPSQLPTTPS